MRRAPLVTRLALAALAVGAVACKPEASPSGTAAGSSPATAGGTSGDTTAEVKRPALDRKLPPMPRRLGDGSAAGSAGSDDADQPRRGGRWAEGVRPNREEMRARRDERRKEMLELYDADKDGQLDDQERALVHEARVADLVARIDQDADGRLTKEEMDAMASRGRGGGRRPVPDFAAIDTDHDGYVTVEEFAAARPPRLDGPGGPGGRARRQPPGSEPRPPTL